MAFSMVLPPAMSPEALRNLLMTFPTVCPLQFMGLIVRLKHFKISQQSG